VIAFCRVGKNRRRISAAWRIAAKANGTNAASAHATNGCGPGLRENAIGPGPLFSQVSAAMVAAASGIAAILASRFQRESARAVSFAKLPRGPVVARAPIFSIHAE